MRFGRVWGGVGGWRRVGVTVLVFGSSRVVLCVCRTITHARHLFITPFPPCVQLILPYLDLKIEYYDLGLPNRDKTNDQVGAWVGWWVGPLHLYFLCVSASKAFNLGWRSRQYIPE